MSKTQKPLMLAYIIFLIITLFYHLIAMIFSLEFPMWETIIVAATIASYAFSLSSISKCFIKQNQEYVRLLNQYLILSKTLQQKEKETLKEGDNKIKLLENGKDIINHTVELISVAENQVRKNAKISFWFDMGGYLVFFCIICFEAICNFFHSSQDTFTLVAFIILLLVGYIESVITVKYENVFKVLIKSTQDTIEYLEDKNNG